MLLYFGFTRCPDICPSELLKVGDTLDLVGAENLANLNTLFVSVDPNRDTLQQLKVYAKDFHPTIEVVKRATHNVPRQQCAPPGRARSFRSSLLHHSHST